MHSLHLQISIWFLSLSSTLVLGAVRDANSTTNSDKHAFIENLVAQMTVPEMGALQS